MKVPRLDLGLIRLVVLLISGCYGYGDEPVELHGIVFMDGGGYASLSSAQKQSGWLKAGQQFERCLVKKIEVDRIVIVAPDNSERVVFLTIAKIGISDPAVKPTPVEQLDWKWINSNANPWRREAPDLPYEIANGWDKLSESERLRIENNYRNHGWGIIIERKAGQLSVSRFHLREPGYSQKLDPGNLVEAGKINSTTEKPKP